MYPSIDFESILGYSNKCDMGWMENYPKFEGQVC
jgi:hypothetical protein